MIVRFEIAFALGIVFVDAVSSSINGKNPNCGPKHPLCGPKNAWTGGSTASSGFFESEEEDNPWLQIRIIPAMISSVRIINRNDKHGDRLRNLVIRAGPHSGPLTNEIVGKFEGPGKTGAEHVIDLDRNVLAEYITVQMEGRGILHVNGMTVQEAGK